MTIKEAQLAISAKLNGEWAEVFRKDGICLDGDFNPEQLRFIADTMDKIGEDGET